MRMQNDLCPYCRAPYLPENARAGDATDSAGGNNTTDASLYSMLEHLQSRWEAAHEPGERAVQRPLGGSGMYS